MRKIEAIIRPAKLEELKAALNEVDIRGMTVYNVMGRGMTQGVIQYYRGQEVSVDLFPKVKIEIICHEEDLEMIIDIILKVCSTGQIGDGKIFVFPLEEIIRIRTGERGASAL